MSPETRMPDWAQHVRPRLASLRLSPTREIEIVDELSDDWGVVRVATPPGKRVWFTLATPGRSARS